ncbi:MAG: DJ-1/PfpI family protein [Clostridiales bacterium]|nr:DJ-1/PfpI family protein [Clostridiales bacterium]
MKKMVILLLIIMLIFTACGKPATKDTSSPKQETKVEAKQEEKITSTKAPTEAPTEAPTPEPIPLPTTVAVVVCRDGYAPSEFHPVMDALAAAGYDIVLVSDEMGDADGFSEKIAVEKTFEDFEGTDLLGIVLIGGSDSLWENTELHRLLNEVHELDRVTAGICLNSVTLAKAGIIKEGQEACWANHDTMTDPVMADLGVEDSGQLVTVDGNVITGNGPPASDEFAAEIVTALDAL